ncbi:MAG: trypsin-like peptidase domain-containing protein [Patescibacteria group bacterium]|nr:trypsin-like peptidase domain-containing protein [Patescibacteria group bacterium]MDE2015532.1 trypsin-like peptidase domain-containing protein [Patescibacteria group bacterium]MDE2226852.1 trypsin-like peptidase domain-containing protein [Patescibacteria group bacterium]
MKNWMKENWFKMGIILIGSVVALSLLTIVGNNVSRQSDLSSPNSAQDIASSTEATGIPSAPSAEQQQIDQLKQEVADLKQQNHVVTDSGSTNTAQDIISQSEVEPYKKTVVKVSCFNNGALYDWGSGTLIANVSNTNSKWSVLTNRHVIQTDTCEAYNYYVGAWYLDTAHSSYWNNQADEILLNVTSARIPNIPSLDVLPAPAPPCAKYMQTGFPVVVLGYPFFANHNAYDFNQTLESGTISATDRQPFNTSSSSYPVDVNYYTSAKVDSGNSGGMALSKQDGRLCVLGLPTWVSLGNTTNEGVIQSMNNVTFIPHN